MTMRFHLPPGGDVPPVVAARRLACTLEEFKAKLPQLEQRGFPAADPTTGNYDLDAIDTWRRARHPHLFAHGPLLTGPVARDAKDVVRGRLVRVGGG